jgi:hypothetical protein
MRKTVILAIVRALASATPALACPGHHRHSNAAAAGRTDGTYQPPRDRADVPWAPF